MARPSQGTAGPILLPLAVMLEIGAGASLALLWVMVWALLLVPTTCAVKSSEVEDNPPRGVMDVTPDPVEVAVCPSTGLTRGGSPRGTEACPGPGDEGGPRGGTTGPGQGTTVTSMPVPVTVTVWVLPVTALLLSVIVSLPVREPLVVGMKLT